MRWSFRFANSHFGATVLYGDSFLWLEYNIKRYVTRLVMVDAVPARMPMAFPAPTKSLPFSLLRNSNRNVAYGTPFLR